MKTKKGISCEIPFPNKFAAVRLLTQAKLLNNCTIAFNVALLQVVEQSTTLTYQHCQSSFSTIILSVELKVLSQMSNTV